MVGQRQPRDLDRVVHRDELGQLEGDAMRVVGEMRVAMTVPHQVFAELVPYRERRRAPEHPTLLVAHIEHVARRVAHGIVRPGREQVLLAVDGPGASGARVGHEAAEIRIREDVDPRRGRPLSLTEHHHVFASVGIEAAQAIEVFECRGRSRRICRPCCHRRRCREGNTSCRRIGTRRQFDLLGERSSPTGKRHARDRLQDNPLHSRERFSLNGERCALNLRVFRGACRFAVADQFFQLRLDFVCIRR